MVQHTKPRSDLHQQSISLTSKKTTTWSGCPWPFQMGGTFTARPWKRHCRHKVWAASCFDAYPKCHWLNPLSFRNIPSWVPHVCRLYLTTIAFIYLYISLSYSQKKTDDIPIIAGYFIFPRFVGNRTQYILKISGLLIYPQYMAIAQ